MPTPTAEDYKRFEGLANAYSKARERVATLLNEIEDASRTIHRKYRRSLNEAIANAETHHEALFQEVDANRGLFEKPRTWSFFGIKFGLGAARGSTTWENDDDEKLIARIRKLLPTEQADKLIRVKEEPIVDALRELDAKTLAKLGVQVSVGTGLVVVVKPVESATEKLLKRILKESAGRIDEQEAATSHE
jgi:hypothetical protein